MRTRTREIIRNLTPGRRAVDTKSDAMKRDARVQIGEHGNSNLFGHSEATPCMLLKANAGVPVFGIRRGIGSFVRLLVLPRQRHTHLVYVTESKRWTSAN